MEMKLDTAKASADDEKRERVNGVYEVSCERDETLNGFDIQTAF